MTFQLEKRNELLASIPELEQEIADIKYLWRLLSIPGSTTDSSNTDFKKRVSIVLESGNTKSSIGTRGVCDKIGASDQQSNDQDVVILKRSGIKLIIPKEWRRREPGGTLFQDAEINSIKAHLVNASSVPATAHTDSCTAQDHDVIAARLKNKILSFGRETSYNDLKCKNNENTVFGCNFKTGFLVGIPTVVALAESRETACKSRDSAWSESFGMNARTRIAGLPDDIKLESISSDAELSESASQSLTSSQSSSSQVSDYEGYEEMTAEQSMVSSDDSRSLTDSDIELIELEERKLVIDLTA